MSGLKQSFIEKPEETDLSFDALRRQGIKLLQELSSNIWTDYNLHDPGITILEQLCFAITDLAYRGNFTIEEILADEHGNINHNLNSYLNTKDILCSNPVTINDFRKVLIDRCDFVENVWLEVSQGSISKGQMNGIYTVKVKLKNSQFDFGSIQVAENKIAEVLSEFRNICEKFDEIIILKPQKIRIEAELLIKDDHLPDHILVNVFTKIDAILNPTLIVHNEQELLMNRMKMDEIYTGPLLSNGIILDDDLLPLISFIDHSQIIDAILQVNDVLLVNSFKMFSGNVEVNSITREDNCFIVIYDANIETDIKLVNKTNELLINKSIFSNLVKKGIEARRKKSNKVTVHRDALLNTIENKNIRQYYSLQDFFPAVYGIGQAGLTDNETTKHKAEARQLKGYLMLFEQVLANHLSQLDNIKNIFSLNGKYLNGHTYYSQPIYDVPGARDIIKAFKKDVVGRPLSVAEQYADDQNWTDFIETRDNNYIKSLTNIVEDRSEYYQRKNKIADHVLARYNEVISGYPVTAFNEIYFANVSKDINAEILEYKHHYYNHILPFGLNRTTANNYLKKENSSMLEMKVVLLLYIKRLRFKANTFIILGDKTEDRYTNRLTENLQFYKGNKIESNSDSESGHNEGKGHSFTFTNQSISFFIDGLKISNYTISNTGNDFIVKYKFGNQELGKYHTRDEASKAIKHFINYLTVLNVNTEGFHIVEHITLAPSLHTKSYAYNYNNTGLHKGLTWQQREGQIADIIFRNKLGNDGKSYNPLFSLYVMLNDHSLIQEDFFNLQITIVLPTWPARFQNRDFKTYIMKVFGQNIPAHIRINYKWLNINSMYKFESLFFNWQKGGPSFPHNDDATKIIKMIASDSYLSI